MTLSTIASVHSIHEFYQQLVLASARQSGPRVLRRPPGGSIVLSTDCFAPLPLQAPADTAVVAVLREAKEHISALQSALEAKEDQWQHMLARARSDHEERQLLKARVELLEQELAAAKQRSSAR